MRIVSGIFMQITTELLESCEVNDRRGQKKLYELFFKMHMGLCFRYMANEDDARIILNTAFMKVCTNIGTIKNNPVVFYSWSKKIAMNCILDEFRRTKRIQEKEIPKEFDREIEHTNSSFANDGLESLLEDDLHKIIAALPQNMRTAFMMFAVEGFSHKEISDALNINEGTSKWLVHEARKTLKITIEKNNNWNSKKMVI